MNKILVVEDDTILNKTLSYNLMAEGYDVESVFTVKAAMQFIEVKKYDLVVLDINLPDGNGFDLCGKIKLYCEDTAVVFLTAKDMESDMIRGYELGAIDYITKPFHISVFQKKVKAMFRMITSQCKDYYDDGYLQIDFLGMTASMGGNIIVFTPMEYRTLNIFTKNTKIVLTRQTLLEKLWDIDRNFVDEHTLTTTISRIRSKIEKGEKQYIKTVYGMGYMWVGGVGK